MVESISTRSGRKYFQIIYLIMDWYPKYENLYNLIVKIRNNLTYRQNEWMYIYIFPWYLKYENIHNLIVKIKNNLICRQNKWIYIFFQRHTNGSQAHEKMLNITNHQGNANQYHNHLIPITMIIIKQNKILQVLTWVWTKRNSCVLLLQRYICSVAIENNMGLSQKY